MAGPSNEISTPTLEPELINQYREGMQSEMATMITGMAVHSETQRVGDNITDKSKLLGVLGAASAVAMGFNTVAEAASNTPRHSYEWLKKNCEPTRLVVDEFPKNKHISGKKALIDFKVKYVVNPGFKSGTFTWKQKSGEKYCGIARRDIMDNYTHKTKPTVLAADSITASGGNWTDTAAKGKYPDSANTLRGYGRATQDFILYTRKK